MSYPDYTGAAIRKAKDDAILFDSVGLGWIANICRRKAGRLEQGRTAPTRRADKTN